MRFTLQDFAATLVSVILALGLVLLALFGEAIPPELGTAVGTALGWLFARSAQAAVITNGNHV